MRVGYVVLYVEDPESSVNFWTSVIGMVPKGEKNAGDFTIRQVGFPDQPFAIELVPLELMRGMPHGLDLATPSMAFRVPDLFAAHADLKGKGVVTSDINDMAGVTSFAFQDNEENWFAVLAE